MDTVLPFVKAQIGDLGISSEQAIRVVSDYENLVRAHFPEVLEESRGIAESSGIEYSEALLVLFFWEIRDTVSHSYWDCSSFVAAGLATDEGDPIASQNSDWPRELRNKSIGQTFIVEPEGKYRFIGRGLAGNLGRPSVIGFNEKGLTFVGSGINQLKGGGFGFPPLTVARMGIENCGSVDEFLKLVGTIPRWSHAGENLIVVDTNGSMARISFTTHHTMCVSTKNHFLASTNHYHNLEMRHFGPSSREDYPSSYHRYDRLVELLRKGSGELNPQRAKEIMSDHKYGNTPPEGNNSICRHGEDIRTMMNLILAPRTGEFWISEGNPCEKKYSKFSL